MNKDDVRYFLLLSIVTADILPVGMVYSLVFTLEQLGFTKFGLYIGSKTNKHILVDAYLAILGSLFQRDSMKWKIGCSLSLIVRN